MANMQQALAALADPTRRQIFERLQTNPGSVGEIAQGLCVSRPAVSQHLKVLRLAGLATDRAHGSRRVYEIDAAGLGALRAWLDRFWTASLTKFAESANQGDNDERDNPTSTNPQDV